MFRRNTPTKHKYFCKRCKDQNWIVECTDGCGGIFPRYDRVYRLRLFLKNHDKIGKTPKNIKKGQDHPNWKGGRSFDKTYGYWMLYIPDYYLSKKSGYVREHVYFYQEYHKCCVLKWAVVHHIDHNKENNMPWNLQGMMRSDHISYHHKGKIKEKIDKSDRRCSDPKCKNPDKRHYDKNGYERWFIDRKGNWLCINCQQRWRRNLRLEKVIL